MKNKKILEELKGVLNEFYKKCIEKNKDSDNCIIEAIFGKENWIEDPLRDALKNYLNCKNYKVKKNFKNTRVDIIAKKNNKTILIEVKSTKGKQRETKEERSLYCISGKKYEIKGKKIIDNKNENMIITYIVKIKENSSEKYCNLNDIAESQVAAYALREGYSNDGNSIIPVVYYVKENELWYIEEIKNNKEDKDTSSGEFKIFEIKNSNESKNSNKSNEILISEENYEIYKVVAKKIEV